MGRYVSDEALRWRLAQIVKRFAKLPLLGIRTAHDDGIISEIVPDGTDLPAQDLYDWLEDATRANGESHTWWMSASCGASEYFQRHRMPCAVKTVDNIALAFLRTMSKVEWDDPDSTSGRKRRVTVVTAKDLDEEPEEPSFSVSRPIRGHRIESLADSDSCVVVSAGRGGRNGGIWPRLHGRVPGFCSDG